MDQEQKLEQSLINGEDGSQFYDESLKPKDDAITPSNDTYDPNDLPKEVQLLRWENLAIPGCYLVVGLMLGMIKPLLNVWPLDLGASEAQQTTFAQLASLPATLKIFYGFWSDVFPIAGYRRKPYMVIGWLLSVFAMVNLIRELGLSFDPSQGDYGTLLSKPSLTYMAGAFFMYGVGMWSADVMADSVVAQKTRLEPEHRRGNLQSTCYISRFFGTLLGAPTATYVYSEMGPGVIVVVVLVVPLCLLPLVVCLKEDLVEPPALSHQFAEIWRTVCRRSVWQPLGFIYLFHLLQVSNSAWRQYLSTVLHFSAAELNNLLVAAYVMLFIGSSVYKWFFLQVSWRRLYQICIGLIGFTGMLQLLLIQGITFGIPDFWFALGDDSFAQFIGGILFLPDVIMMASLCPVGSEGASYAMFTTISNAAIMLSPAISSMLLGIWDVSKDALVAGELQGLFNLTLMITLINMAPVLLVFLLPHDREELHGLANSAYSGSKWGGYFILLVLFGSMANTVVISLANILHGGLS